MAGNAPNTAAPRLVIVSGPSGVGKGSVIAAARRLESDLGLAVSVTTRQPRQGEVNGTDYYFVTEAAFREMIGQGAFLEYASYGGNRYGTPLSEISRLTAAGQKPVLEIEMHGARQVKQRLPETLAVFLAPPSWDELVRRLRGRSTESNQSIQDRLAIAMEELDQQTAFDVVLVNADVDETAKRLCELVSYYMTYGLQATLRLA